MKKIKLLAPIASIAGLTATVAPMMAMTSCNCSTDPFSESTSTDFAAKYTEYYETWSSATHDYTTATFADGNYVYKTSGKQDLSNKTGEVFYPVSLGGICRVDFAETEYYTYTAGLPWNSLETILTGVQAGYKDAHSDIDFSIKYYMDSDKNLQARVIGGEDVYYKATLNKEGYIYNIFVKETLEITVASLGKLKFAQEDVNITYSK